MTFCWKCRRCGFRTETETYDPDPCSSCGRMMRRDYKAEQVAVDPRALPTRRANRHVKEVDRLYAKGQVGDRAR